MFKFMLTEGARNAHLNGTIILIIISTGCLLIIELFNLAIIQAKINIKALFR